MEGNLNEPLLLRHHNLLGFFVEVSKYRLPGCLKTIFNAFVGTE